jgi:hypothetical protein
VKIEDDGTLLHPTSVSALGWRSEMHPSIQNTKTGCGFFLTIWLNWVTSWNMYQENVCQVLHFYRVSVYLHGFEN